VYLTWNKADNSWERGEFIVEVSLPGSTHTLPGHQLIHCEASATRLNRWSWEVGGRSIQALCLHFTVVKDPPHLTKDERFAIWMSLEITLGGFLLQAQCSTIKPNYVGLLIGFVVCSSLLLLSILTVLIHKWYRKIRPRRRTMVLGSHKLLRMDESNMRKSNLRGGNIHMQAFHKSRRIMNNGKKVQSLPSQLPLWDDKRW